jgi:hypothetical protein
MIALGISPQNIGIFGGRGFNPAGSTVGGNVRGVGIELDSGLFGKIKGFSAWNNARLSTRVDAVIAHEYEELLGATHAQALRRAPNTTLNISEEARKLLRAMRDLE